ncbi:cystathionine gamma-lyase, partial [Aphelenchoides avenae]
MAGSSKTIRWSAKPLYSEYAGSSSLNDSGNSSPSRLSPNSGFKRRESDVSETTVVHGLQRHKEWGAEMVPPISLGTTYKWKPVIPDEEVYHALSNGDAHVYGRYGNPTRTALEKNLAALEDGKFCRVYSSGMSACAALINVLKTGDHIIVANNIYGGVQSYLNNVSIAKHGIDVAYIDFSDLGNLSRALKDTTRMVWLENPSNPLLQVVDIQAMASITKAYNKDIIVVVDNTIMTPYFQKPLSLGACAVIHSVTKYLNGHTDALMGAIVTNSDLLDNHCFEMQY